MDFKFDLNPSLAKTIFHALKIKARFLFKNGDSVKELPVVTDERIIMVNHLLVSLTHPAYGSGKQYLFLEIIFKFLDLLFEYGQTPASPGGVMLYASFLASDNVQDFKKACEWGSVGESMSYQYKKTVEIASGRFAYLYFVDRWINPLRDSIPFLWLNHRENLSVGAVTVASAALLTVFVIKFLTGEKLEALHQEVLQGIQELQKSTALAEEIMLTIVRETCLSLMGKNANPVECCPPSFCMKYRKIKRNHLPHCIKFVIDSIKGFCFTFLDIMKKPLITSNYFFLGSKSIQDYMSGLW